MFTKTWYKHYSKGIPKILLFVTPQGKKLNAALTVLGGDVNTHTHIHAHAHA